MDAKRLDEWEELANAATPGPWKQGEDCMLLHDTGYCIADVTYYWNVNVPFIAASRTAIPELIEEVRRLSQRDHTCECSEDEACAHVRRAEKAEAEVERLQSVVKAAFIGEGIPCDGCGTAISQDRKECLECGQYFLNYTPYTNNDH